MKKSVWYWPKLDQLLLARNISSRYMLMFHESDWYYFNPITPEFARSVGMVKIASEL